MTQERNLHLTISFVASANNPADEFSRNLYWNWVQDLFGGPSGHNLDLMSLDSVGNPECSC